MPLVEILLGLLLSWTVASQDCVTFSSSKSIYESTDKFVKWSIHNNCNKQKYYLIGLQVKNDTGWIYINSYVHAIMQKDFLAILEIAANKQTTDEVELDKILREQSLKGINLHYRQYRLTLDFYERKDFDANANSPKKYAYFEVHD